MFPERRQAAGCRVDSEHDDVVGVQVGGEEKPAACVDLEITWPLTPSQDMLDGPQHPGLGIDRVDDDRVMPAIRAVNKFPGRMDAKLCGRVPAFEPLGKSRDGLNLVQGAALGLIAECRHSVEAMGVDSPALAARMGSEVDQEFVCTQGGNSQGQEGKCKKKP